MPIGELYKQEPPRFAVILGKGPSLDRWTPWVFCRSNGFAVFACNESVHVTPHGGYWVTGEGAFARLPAPDGCTAIKQYPGNRETGGEYTWKYDDFRIDTERKGVGSVAIAILGEWLEAWGASCRRLDMVGFDAFDRDCWYDPDDRPARPMYASCIPRESLYNNPVYVGTTDKKRMIRRYNYTWANAAIRSSFENYGHLFESVEWLHRTPNPV